MWEDFERGIRSKFKDYLEKKDARAKLKRTKQMNKVREYISLMQSLNIDARYDEEFLWETIYNSLKPKLKEMWVTIVTPEDLQEKYTTLVKLGAVVEVNKMEQKKSASSSTAEAGDDEKKKKRRRKEKKKKSERLTASS